MTDVMTVTAGEKNIAYSGIQREGLSLGRIWRQNMNSQNNEVGQLELSVEEMDQVSGGMLNRDLPVFKVFEMAYLRVLLRVSQGLDA